MSQDLIFSRVTNAIEAFSRGEMVVVMDDDDRENEGDIFLAAQFATPEKLAFIIRHSSGIVCAPLPRDLAQKLNLSPMVANNDAPLSTAFTISVDAKDGLTTGISALERSNTLRALANVSAEPRDFVRPGHIFPLIAKDGGVLFRSGHTEAVVDLCKLAKLAPVGVICELVNDDGSVKQGQQVIEFAKDHGLLVLTIADLISYRQARENLVICKSTQQIQTQWGAATHVVYKSSFDELDQSVLIFGNIQSLKTVPVRFHRENIVDDIFSDQKLLNTTIQEFQKLGGGILVYLRTAALSQQLNSEQNDGKSLHESFLQDECHSTALQRQKTWREIGLGAQILRSLHITKIHLISRRAHRYVGLEGFGIEITGQSLLG